jgi:SpoU rRNA methylase family enzyme
VGTREFVVVVQPGEEELGPVVGHIWLIGEPEAKLVLIWPDLDDAQRVLADTADLAAGDEDRGLQQRLFRAAGCGDGKRLAVVLEECAEGLVGFERRRSSVRARAA